MSIVSIANLSVPIQIGWFEASCRRWSWSLPVVRHERFLKDGHLICRLTNLSWVVGEYVWMCVLAY